MKHRKTINYYIQTNIVIYNINLRHEIMKKNIAFDTLNALDVFSDAIFSKDTLVFHIPHSSIYIPIKDDLIDYINIINNVDINSTINEINLLTDWYTDKIFDVKNHTKIVTPFSRVFCDVERLEDENEEMFKYGRGFYYTKTDDGQVLRLENPELKKLVYENYYIQHHKKLNDDVNHKLEEYGNVLIIDCHSFNDIPLNTDTNKSKLRPDICLGTDEFHTPKYIQVYVKNYFEKLGYVVKINSPYSGTMIPLEHYKENKNVKSIMIEINKNLYLDNNNNPLDGAIEKLNKEITNLFN